MSGPRKTTKPMSVTTTINPNPLAVSLAETVVLSGVAEQVVALLTGKSIEQVREAGSDSPPSVGVSKWDAERKVPESSDRTMTLSEDDGELSELLKMVRGRTSSQRRKPKPASS